MLSTTLAHRKGVNCGVKGQVWKWQKREHQLKNGCRKEPTKHAVMGEIWQPTGNGVSEWWDDFEGNRKMSDRILRVMRKRDG